MTLLSLVNQVFDDYPYPELGAVISERIPPYNINPSLERSFTIVND
jgi:hypothetical protein